MWSLIRFVHVDRYRLYQLLLPSSPPPLKLLLLHYCIITIITIIITIGNDKFHNANLSLQRRSWAARGRDGAHRQER
jgi:hypothetical protein